MADAMDMTKLSDAVLRFLLEGKRGQELFQAFNSEFPTFRDDYDNHIYDVLRLVFNAMMERTFTGRELFRDYDEWFDWGWPEDPAEPGSMTYG